MTKQEIDRPRQLIIARRLMELRKNAGILQATAAKDLGLNIGSIEAARKDISISSLEKFCRYYGVTLEEFLEGLEI